MRENVVPSWREREERACGMKKKKNPAKLMGQEWEWLGGEIEDGETAWGPKLVGF
jgi:hypothetical protein